MPNDLLDKFEKGIARTSYSGDKCHSHFPFAFNRGMDARHEECIMEIWKDVVGWEGLYQVSNEGRVKRLSGTNQCSAERLLKPEIMKHGYQRYKLYDSGRNQKILAHRLVAEAFIPNTNNYPEVNHKDENPSNNRVENLEWCDHTYNMNYGTCRERTSNALKIFKNTEEQKRKVSEQFKGKPFTEEHRRRISESLKRRYA